MWRFLKSLVVLVVICLSVTAITVPHASANVQDFTIASFEADYYLSRDNQKNSQLRVTEKIIATFPGHDQNHGIERAIPNKYDGHPVDLSVISVTDAAGGKRAYTMYTSGGNTVLRIGDVGKYVHGSQTYEITYTLKNVTKQHADHDEFYWDTNGTQWKQQVQNMVARLHVPSEIAIHKQQQKCFTGSQGSTVQGCAINTIPTDDGVTVRFTATKPLAGGQNMSLVVGFDGGTFAKYVPPPMSLLQTLAIIGLVLLVVSWYVVFPVIVIVRAIIRWRNYGRDAGGKKTIVPEYVPPKGISLTLADTILHDRMSPKAITAQIIDLAIKGYIKIIVNKKDKYSLEIIKEPTDIGDDERRVLQLVFDEPLEPGKQVKVADLSSKLYSKVQEEAKIVKLEAIERGWMTDTNKLEKYSSRVGWILLILGCLSLNPLVVVAALVSLIVAHYMPTRTAEGVALRDHLYGLKDYMQIAESERIRRLQAPGTVERIDVADNAQLVKLYERLLPYALLFGIEKEWAQKFVGLYTEPPQWYAGNWIAFNAAVFAGSLNSFSGATQTSFAPPTSSSSSGFSSGGGFSGGGGGGGGGGGW